MYPADIQMRFGAAVRARRKGLAISQEELAGRAGLHRTYVADVERGARNLSLASIDKLAGALDVSIATLFSLAAGGTDLVGDGAVEILLVEDDAGIVAQILKVFEGFQLSNRVHVVRDGAEALEFIFGDGRQPDGKAQHRPQVVLLDLTLPRVNGLEVLRRIKQDKQTRAMRVVTMANSQHQEGAAESLRLGAEICLVKPVDSERFLQIVPQLNLGLALLRPVPRPPS